MVNDAPFITRGAKRAFLVVSVLALLLAATSILFTVHYVQASQAAQQRQAAAVQAAQRHAGQLVEDKICTTVHRLAALNPPPGNGAANPSRAYLQQQHDILAELGPDLGCTRESP